MGKNGSRVVTVFGGSRVGPGTAEYDEARLLGRLLAESGYVVCNGGYSGTMEAAARGARECGGHIVGCTVDLLADREMNEWTSEEERSSSLLERLEALTRRADAFIALRGGVGTLLELALVWNLAQLDGTARQPIILVGEAWRRVVAVFGEELHVRPEDLSRVEMVETVEMAVLKLRALLDRPVTV